MNDVEDSEFESRKPFEVANGKRDVHFAATSLRKTSLLMLSVALIHSDQNLLAPNLTAAADDLGLTDPADRDEKLGGGLAFGLFLVGAPAALLIGARSDGLLRKSGKGWNKPQRGRFIRTRADLLAIVLLIGAAGCAGSALAATYPTLFVARAITGVSLAGGLPLAMSLVSDLYGPERRTSMSGWIGVAMKIGVLAGQSLAGWIGPTRGWRSPFQIVSALMVIAAFVIKTLWDNPSAKIESPGTNEDDDDNDEASLPLTEPRTESMDSSDGSQAKEEDKDHSPAAFCASMRQWSQLTRIRTFWLVMIQGIFGCVPWGVIHTFLPDYLHIDAGLTVHSATVVMGFFQMGGFAGTVLGSELGQRLYNIRPTLPPALMLIAGCLGVVPVWILIRSTPSHSILQCSLLAFAGGSFASVTGPIIRATLCNVTEPSQRGVAFASFMLFDDVGKGAGPALVAAMVRAWGRKAAFAASMLCWIPSAVLNGMTAWTVKADQRITGSGWR